jgi:hypothetical protein
MDPLTVASDGLRSGNAITIATGGYIVTVTSEIVNVPVPISVGIGGASSRYKTKKRKRITASVVIEGKSYTSTLEVDDLKVTPHDVQVEILYETLQPKLVLTLLE